MKSCFLLLILSSITRFGLSIDLKAHSELLGIVAMPDSDPITMEPVEINAIGVHLGSIRGPMHLGRDGAALSYSNARGGWNRGIHVMTYIDGCPRNYRVFNKDGLWYYNGLLLPLIHSAYKGQYVALPGASVQYEPKTESIAR